MSKRLLHGDIELTLLGFYARIILSANAHTTNHPTDNRHRQGHNPAADSDRVTDNPIPYHTHKAKPSPSIQPQTILYNADHHTNKANSCALAGEEEK
ncbi:hypothetical protein [Bifidobacterium actinocoloniiforme]|uniref:hypothetical protein n=1 Tax=Bifidobacterium actinocoloniiforme TaxID=638619 RepID=UPI000AF38C4E|nr:hypothetical protein [Bifidobacterium actinocoloniiforme]